MFLCQKAHRIPAAGTSAVTTRDVLQAHCTWMKQDLHYDKSSPQLSQKIAPFLLNLQTKVLCRTLLEKASKSSAILILHCFQ